MGYPANICLSVNDCVVHGIPDRYVLKEWDLLKIDAWINYHWYITDAAISVIVGGKEKNDIAYKLVKSTKKALDEWFKTIAVWKSMNKFSKKVFETLKKYNFSIIKNLTWHWVWKSVHEKPNIYNYPNYYMKNLRWQKNMVVALEPITAIYSDEAVEKKNIPWNMYTKFWDLGAQWEYTVIVTDNWPEILAGVIEFD